MSGDLGSHDAERLARVVRSISDAFLVLDRDWCFTYLNDRALEYLGTDRKSAMNHVAFDVVPAYAGTEWERQVRRAMEDRVAVDFELYYPKDSDSVSVRAYPISDGVALIYRAVAEGAHGVGPLRRRIAVIDGINRILRAALTAADEAELGRECLSVAEEITESPFGFISELKDDGLLHDVAVSNPGWEACADVAEQHRRLRSPTRLAGLHGSVLKGGRSFFTNDPAHHPDRVGLPPGHPPLHCFLGTPLKEGAETFGLIAVANRRGGYDNDSAQLLEVLAPAIVEAFQRLRAEKRQHRRASFDRVLNDISAAAHSSLDDRMILQGAVGKVALATGLNAIGVHVRGDGEWSFPYTYGLPTELAELRLRDEQAPMSLGVIESQQPIVMTDTMHDPRANRPLIERFDIRSLVGFPLIVRGQPFGVLFAGSIGETAVITEDEVGFLERVASTLSLALENARLYEAEHRIAETLQQALLALPSAVGGVSFAHAYRSAAEAARVGGDFYDIFEVEHDRIAVVIGDVAGKGLEAAALTSLLKNAIRAHASDRRYSAADVLRMTSELMYRVTPTETFATVFLAIIECATGRLTYSNAGHTTAAILGSQGGIRRLPSNSSLVGAFEEAPFALGESELCPGELLLLFTDGVVEARSHGELYGEDRLFALVSEMIGGTPETVVRAVVSDLLHFSEGRLTDDAAIISVSLLGPEATMPTHQEVSLP